MFAGTGTTEVPSASSKPSHTGMATATALPVSSVVRRVATAREVCVHPASGMSLVVLLGCVVCGDEYVC